MVLTAGDWKALSYWGIHKVLTAHRAPGGVLNRILVLETETGAFVLRAYRAMPLARLMWEHRVIRHAVERGICTPPPIPSREGESYIELDGQRYALFPYIAGRQLNREEISPVTAHIMGAFLGDMEQRLTACAVSEAPLHKLVAYESGSRAQSLAAVEELIQVINLLPQHGADEHMALAYLEGQRDWLADSAHELSLARDYRLILTHGDFQESNIFFVNGQVSAVIDWERSRVAPWGWDIVRASHLMLRLDPVLCRAFLDGYKTTASVDERELALTAALYGEERDMDDWLFRAIYIEGNDRARRFLNADGFRPFREKWRELSRNL